MYFSVITTSILGYPFFLALTNDLVTLRVLLNVLLEFPPVLYFFATMDTAKSKPPGP
jgi:hypothetical protein